MNIVEIAGHLGADPEERVTPTGQKLVTFRVASAVKKDVTLWWKVSIWGDRFDRVLPHLKKGRPVIVIGEMAKPDVYVDKSGVSQVSLQMTAEIIRFSPFGTSENKTDQTPSRSVFAPVKQAIIPTNEEEFIPF